MKYKISKERKEIIIYGQENLSCKLWGENWGSIHNIIEKWMNKKKISKIQLNLSSCIWADPIPLLSIILDLYRIKYKYRAKILVILPKLDQANLRNQNWKRGQFLKFLASQGFLDILVTYFEVRDYKFPVNKKTIDKYANYQYKLLYGGAEVVRAKIYDITDEYQKKEIIEGIENEIFGTLRNTTSMQNFNNLITQTYNILNELIDNVYNHAYLNDERKIFGLYIRRRYGAAKKFGIDDDKDINIRASIVKKERENCPALDTQILIDSDAILEIFFVDIGMGLKGSLRDYYTAHDKDYKYPIRELFCKILKDGVRKNASASLTPFGGLHFVCRLMEESNGYIWCNEGNEWVGSSSVNLVNNGKDIKIGLTGTYSPFQMTGLSWGFRIPYSDTLKRKNSIATTWMAATNKHPVFKAYQNLDKKINASYIMVFDDRYTNTVFLNGNVENWKKAEGKDNINFDGGINRVDTFVWFPQYYYSKNRIIRNVRELIYNIQNNRSEKKINLIVGEIDSNELNSFYYTFNEYSSIRFNMEIVDKILLITKKWEVVCFKNHYGVFKNNIEGAKEFYNTSITNSTVLHNSIILYARMLKAYDSYIFWNMIKKYENEKLFINAKVKWSDKNIITGYLDFERIYLYKELYDVLKRALLRIAGCVQNSEVEFRHIDSAAARICQDANIECLSFEYNSLFSIFVSAACASGYTRDAYYEEGPIDFNVIFFAHPSFDKKIQDTAFLLIWPDERYFKDYPFEDSMYYRLGKTGLISKKTSESLIDLSSAYDNVIRNKAETYNDLQQKYPRFIKYGHYHTGSHHYLVGFDFITYIRYSYIKKEGAFVYILWKIVSYLSKKGEEKSWFNRLKDTEWTKVMLACDYDDDEKGALIVYHSNTFTEYFMNYIKDILPDSMRKRIVPLNIIYIQSKGGPITFSPFTFDIIKSFFKTENEKGILYIDSNLSTGRNMLEIENILMSTGCQRVKFLSIIDMRRLRNSHCHTISYWRINMPRLDDDSNCILCDTLKKIDSFKGYVEGSTLKRINEWYANWKCTSIINSFPEHGIENEESLSITEDKIRLSNSIALNIFLAEKISESYANDYVYQFIRKKTDLSIYLKMQIICTQICLYGNQNSRQLQLTLLCELVGNMAKHNIVNSYTSLAGVVLISQSESIIYELLNEILYINKNPLILSTKKYLLNSENHDLIIVLAYFMKTYPVIEQLVNGYDNGKEEFNFIKKVNESLLPDKDLKLLSREFEGILVNELGRLRHSTNIQKLLLDHVRDTETYIQNCDLALNDLKRLYDISQKFPIALANSRLQNRGLFTKIRNSIAQIEHLMRQDQNRISEEERGASGTVQFMASEELKSEIRKCESYYLEILRSYFISFSEETKQYFFKKVNEIKDKYGKEIDIKIFGEENNKWYYWNQGIEKEFTYFLENIEHCNKMYEGSTSMKVKIHFQYNNLLIEIKSWSEKTDDVVKQAFLKKNRLSKEQALAFDVMFEFKNEKNSDGYFLLKTIMSIPACYQKLEGE